MMNHKNKVKSFYGVAVLALALLSGCDWCCKKKGCQKDASSSANMQDGKTVLLTIDGKSMITVDQFNDYYNQFLAANPRLQGMIQFLPNAKQEILNGMINEEIVVYWAKQNKVDQNAEYQAELKNAMRMVERGLAAKNFEQTMVGKVAVTDDEIKAYYDQHKDPELIVTPGGVKAMGVEFDSNLKATVFLDRVRGKANNFKALAAESKFTVRDFGPINAMSFDVDKNIQQQVSALKGFPSIIIVETANKKYWVVAALSKEETKYRSLDEVRDGVKAAIEREKLAKIWTDKINELKSKYSIVENKPNFESDKAEMPTTNMPLSQEELASLTSQVATAAEKTA